VLVKSRRSAVVAAGVLTVLLIGVPGQAAEPGSVPLDFSRALAVAGTMSRLHSVLVSHRGELVLERYFNGRGREDLANVKSVSKSIVSALVGIAIARGHIPSVDQPIGAPTDCPRQTLRAGKSRSSTCSRCKRVSRLRATATTVHGI
jgi:hypothetical protein